MRHYGSMEGVRYQVGRITIAFKRAADEIDVVRSVYEAIDPVGSGAGRHRHPGFDETFYICAGRYDFEIDGEHRTLDAGELVVVPRGTPHGFTAIGTEPGRQLIVGTPGGIFEAFIAEVSAAPAGSNFAAIAARHGIEFLT